MTYNLRKSETILPDDTPVYPDYLYIADNVFVQYSGWDDTTVEEWKARTGYKEIRRCDMFDHPGANLGDRVVKKESPCL